MLICFICPPFEYLIVKSDQNLHCLKFSSKTAICGCKYCMYMIIFGGLINIINLFVTRISTKILVSVGVPLESRISKILAKIQ